MTTHNNFYINGAWTAAHGVATANVRNPATEQVIASVALGNQDDVDAAVAAAHAALAAWSQTSIATRRRVLMNIHHGMKAKEKELAAMVTQEVGTTAAWSAKLQVELPTFTFLTSAMLLSDVQFERTVGNSLVVREAVGVVACITPWNYPWHLVVSKVASALAAGCTVVVKPSEVAPLSVYMLAQIMHDAGVPPGVFNLVCGLGAEVGEALVTHPQVDMVSFTGSTAAGKRVSELAAKSVKRVSLELGGKSASVVLPCADMQQAITDTLEQSFANSGQTCAAYTRLLVPQQRYDECAQIAVAYANALQVGDPTQQGTHLGPLVSAAQQERVRNYIGSGVDQGAQLLAGGVDMPTGLTRGYYVQPTVFGKVTSDMTIAREEIFGPVLCIMAYKDQADAIRIANDSDFGLSGAVWAKDEQKALQVAKQMRTGMVDINGHANFNIVAPFGGVKQSGHGRELGVMGIEEFLDTKTIQRKRPLAKLMLMLRIVAISIRFPKLKTN